MPETGPNQPKQNFEAQKMADKEEVESVYWEEKSKGEAFKECCAREYHPYKKVSFFRKILFY